MFAKLAPYIDIARPDHWFKNIFMLPGVLLALFFSPQLSDPFRWGGSEDESSRVGSLGKPGADRTDGGAGTRKALTGAGWGIRPFGFL